MKTPTTLRKSRRIAGLSAALAGLALVGAAHAQFGAEVVSDPTSLAANAAQYGKEAAQWVQQNTQWVQTYATQFNQYMQMVQQYTSMITKVENILNPNLSAVSTGGLTQLSDADKTNYVKLSCPNAVSNGIIGIVAQSLSSVISSNQSPQVQAQAVCVKIANLQLDEYYQAVQMQNQMGQYTGVNGVINQIEALRNNVISSLNSIGDMQANSNQAQRTALQLTSQTEAYRQAIDADEFQIKALQNIQSNLSKSIMSTGGTLLGNAVQMAAFATAFSIPSSQ